MTQQLEGGDMRARTCCRNCGIDTTKSGNWFMVWDHVWLASGLGAEDGVLCVACLEQRIGRNLTLIDFMSTDRANREFWHSDRMLPRRGRERWRQQLELPL